MIRWMTCLLLLLSALSAQAGSVTVQGIRVWTDPDKTRVVFDTSVVAPHRIFGLADPERLVIDLPNTRLTGDLPRPGPDDPNLIRLRSGVRDGNTLRIVVDLKRGVRARSFTLTPNERYGHRLVVDLLPRETAPSGVRAARETGSGSRGRRAVVAIDAGHGGEDPGAIGPGGTREKDITLAIARKLARLVDADPGLQAYLVRDGDYFIALRQRILRARQQRADLFVSIHADAFTNPDAHGASVYTLSHRGASSEAARWLAKRENRADLIGGEELTQSDDLLANVLLDMTQNATLEHGNIAADLVLRRLGGVGALHKREVQQAGFAVLRAPDIPSMLVEVAFISHREEERRLRDSAHQDRLARAILAGIKDYFQKHPLPQTRIAAASGQRGAREYVIAQGDTLSGIAQRHRVSVNVLRRENGLTDDRIRVGQVLSIPEGS